MNEQLPTIIVLEQRTVLFYDDELLAVRATDGHIYVSIRQMCDALGLHRQGQVRRISEHAILSQGYKEGEIVFDREQKNVQATGVLRVDLVPLWLSGVRVSLVRDEVKAKLERFQLEASKVLWEAFQSGRLTTIQETDLDHLLNDNSPAAQAYRMVQAMMQMARSQLILESELKAQNQVLVDHTHQLQNHDERLEQIEETLGQGKQYITNDQASRISQAVKAIAIHLSAKTKRNEYGGVYGELYRQFGITSYKMLPIHQFEPAMKFLTDWHRDLTGHDTLPF